MILLAIRNTLSYFTLGNKTFLFKDKLSGNKVYQFIDCYGDKWLKNSRWGFFSIEIQEDDDIEMLKEAYNLLTNYKSVG